MTKQSDPKQSELFKLGYLKALQWIDDLWQSPLFNHEDIQRCIRRGLKELERKEKK